MYIPRDKNIKSNIVFQKQSVSSQIVEVTEQDISGTEISYTPTQNATKVVYEFQIQYHDDPTSNTFLGSLSNNYIYMQLKRNSGSGYTNLGQGFRLNEFERVAGTQGIYKGKFVIDAWTGSQSLKMSARAKSTNERVTLHLDEASNICHPVIKIYSLMWKKN